MSDDNRPTTSLEEIGFIIRMAMLMPALGIPADLGVVAACGALGLPATQRNLSLLRDIQSYRVTVWNNLSVSTRLEIAFGDTGAPSDFDFYFDRDAITEDDLFG